MKVFRNTPIRLPITQTVLYTFLMDYYHANGLSWGIYLTITVIIWIALIYTKTKEEAIDVENLLQKSTPEQISDFKKKIEEAKEKLSKIKTY